jgi:exosortase K
MKKNIPYYLIGIGFFILLKFWFGNGENDNLMFLLKPTDSLISTLTNSKSVYQVGNGFYHGKLNILIDKSCSGYNFFLLCFLMLLFLSLKYIKRNHHRILSIPVCFIGAYLLTIFVNTSRIYVSIILQNNAIDFLNIEQKIIHESIGIVTNLSFLIIIYLLVDNILINKYAKLT